MVGVSPNAILDDTCIVKVVRFIEEVDIPTDALQML